MKSEIVFQHPRIKEDLRIYIKPDAITWSYGLNTANYPTYGGEVIQILSCFIDDLTVQGTIRTYHDLEKIYGWFIDYIQIATQGRHGHGSFNTVPVKMKYPERGWSFDIYPKTLPGFKYGRDVIAPQWTVVAAIADPSQAPTELQAAILQKAEVDAVENEGNFHLFGAVTGNIGFTKDNPFSDPNVKDVKVKNGKVTVDGEDLNKLADWYNNLIPSYLKGDFGDLSANYSGPVIPATTDKGNKNNGKK